jgi:hypothetical protein
VAGTVPNANSTGASAQVQYAIGAINGARVFFAMPSVHDFDGFGARFFVPRPGENSRNDHARLYRSQSGIQCAPFVFLVTCIDCRRFPVEATPSTANPDGTGLIGLGPRFGSQVLGALNKSTGDPPIDRIFSQDTSIPNFISVLLSRPNDTSEPYTGEMTISEILPEFQNISSQPKVSVSVLTSKIEDDQHFSVLLDADGIIGPDGNAIKTTSNASLAPTHNPQQLQVVFDTGFSLPQLPE